MNQAVPSFALEIWRLAKNFEQPAVDGLRSVGGLGSDEGNKLALPHLPSAFFCVGVLTIKIPQTLARQVGRYWPHMTLDAPYSRGVLGQQNECAPFVVGQVGRPQMDHAVLNGDIPG
jgi:hypothetical protein